VKKGPMKNMRAKSFIPVFLLAAVLPILLNHLE
jgi:hypothetical protein